MVLRDPLLLVPAGQSCSWSNYRSRDLCFLLLLGLRSEGEVCCVTKTTQNGENYRIGAQAKCTVSVSRKNNRRCMTYSLRSKTESSGSTTETIESKADTFCLSSSIKCSSQRLSLISPVLNLGNCYTESNLCDEKGHSLAVKIVRELNARIVG